ncbi:MAG: hypothetical protein E7632_05330 [Ruminococcaceae bacterium]|nr:hypothetical protein [Oscillospiraceae bacterium]
MKKVLFAILLMLAAVITSCGEESYAVTVMVTTGKGCTVVSENPVTLRAGENAVFDVSFDEGWQFAEATAGSFADGKLTVPAVKFPATVKLSATKYENTVKFFVERTGSSGRIYYDHKEYNLYPGTVVMAGAEPLGDSIFVGWSVDSPLSNGGRLYSTDTRIEYTVPNKSRSSLYANFREIEKESAPDMSANNLSGPTKTYGSTGIQGNESTHMIVYHTNGGRVVGFDSDTYYDEVSTAVYSCPNTLPEMGYFARDGYSLLEYNTKPDGSGTAIPCGGKLLPDGDSTELYCIWQKWTDASLFTTSNVGGGLAVTGYKGKEKTLVIPEKIDGNPVVRVKTGAIRDGSYTTLVLPKSMKVIEAGAFADSAAMETLYFYDTIMEIRDSSFSDLSAWKNLRLIAAQLPRYSDREDASFCRKWERILQLSKTDARIMVIHSGSSSYYAMRTPLLEEELGGEYHVVNYGHLARAQVTFYMDAVADFLDSDDILVHAPETGYDGVMGNNEFHWTNFQVIEHSYDLLYHVDDIGFYVKLLDAFTEFNGYRAKMTAQDYDMFVTHMDEYGDRISAMPNNGDPNKFFGKDINFNEINEDWIDNLNTMYNRIMDETGCRIVMSFAPFNYNALTTDSRSEEARENFMARIRELVDIPVISHIWDYMMTGDRMYNSDYHPGDEGRIARTKLLAADLRKFFETEGEK